MASLNEIREKYPQYNNISDNELAEKFYNKFYNHIPREEFNKKIGITTKEKKNEKSPLSKEQQIEEIMQSTGGNRTPVDTLKDIITGLGKGGQNLASTLTGDYAPRVDIEKQFGTEKGNPLVQGVAQYAPGLVGGGASLIGQLLANIAFGYTQGRPGEKNLGGYLPEGRLGSAIEGGVGALLPSVIKQSAKLISKPFIWGKNAFKNIKPYEEAVQNATKEYEATQALPENIQPGVNLSGQPTSELGQIESDIGRELNIGAHHKTRIGDAITNRVKSIENYWKNAYSTFKDNIKNNKVIMPEEAIKNYDLDMNEIKRLVNLNANRSVKRITIIPKKISEEEKSLMSKAPTSKDINASEFLDKYQDFKNARYELSKDMKSAPTRQERNRLRKLYKDTQEIEDKAKKALEEGLGEHAAEFKRLNEGYSTQVHPLRANPLVKKAKKGLIPGNVMEVLSSKESGMPLLKDIVKQDPELMKNILGQRYLKSEGSLHNPDELTEEFLQKNPKLKQLLKNKREYLENTAKRKDISLKIKIKTEKELKNMKKLKRSGITKSLITGGVLTGGTGAGLLHKFNSLTKE